MQLESEEFIGKDMEETLIPESIKESFSLAIKRRSKIENTEIKFLKKIEEDLSAESTAANSAPSVNESGEEISGELEAEAELIFNGYANVMPIRGKDSSLDYYLMVLSTEVFV